MKLADIQKMRFDPGAVVYNTNNKNFAIVLDGTRGPDGDPCSYILEASGKRMMTHTPPNRALILTGKHVDLSILLPALPNGGESRG